jgi:hypothetical protein
MKRRALIAGFILTVLAGVSLAVLVLRGEGDEPSAGASETKAGTATNTAANAVPPESESSVDPIRFVLRSRYPVGRTVAVVIENVGRRAYVFEAYYQACFLSYFDASGRRFIIPPGTHCDLRAKETIRSGERKKLFTWKLDECVKDDWGCAKSRPLPPGTYTIKGRFMPKRAGRPARVETTFTIVANVELTSIRT